LGGLPLLLIWAPFSTIYSNFESLLYFFGELYFLGLLELSFFFLDFGLDSGSPSICTSYCSVSVFFSLVETFNELLQLLLLFNDYFLVILSSGLNMSTRSPNCILFFCFFGFATS
jgi:hypothetical protein